MWKKKVWPPVSVSVWVGSSLCGGMSVWDKAKKMDVCGAPGFIRVMIQLPDDVGDWPVARDCASFGRIVRRFKSIRPLMSGDKP